MYNDIYLLDIGGHTLTKYARNVARVLWSDQTIFDRYRIIDGPNQVMHPRYRSQLSGSENMVKLELLKSRCKSFINFNFVKIKFFINFSCYSC